MADHTLNQSQSREKERSEVFILFPTLPAELRAAIWRATLSPRTIEIRYHDSHGHGWSSAAHVPLALGVCKESRAIISPLYPLCFSGQPGTDSPPRIRMNFGLDTVYLSGVARALVPHFIGMMGQFELSRLRSLAIHERHLFYDIRRALKTLSGLQELLIVSIVGRVYDEEKIGSQLSVIIFDNAPHGNCLREKTDAKAFEHLEVWESPRCRSVYGYAIKKQPDRPTVAVLD